MYNRSVWPPISIGILVSYVVFSAQVVKNLAVHLDITYPKFTVWRFIEESQQKSICSSHKIPPFRKLWRKFLLTCIDTVNKRWSTNEHSMTPTNDIQSLPTWCWYPGLFWGSCHILIQMLGVCSKLHWHETQWSGTLNHKKFHVMGSTFSWTKYFKFCQCCWWGWFLAAWSFC